MADELVIKPVYQQIAIDLASRICNGEFEVGERIHGRSTLAGHYNVSPETVRRAIILLKDMNIVEVYQGSGILVKSRNEAYKFTDKFKHIDSINSLKVSIINLIDEKRKLDDNIKTTVEKLIDYSERFKNTNPFVPLEINITSKCKYLGKTIGEIDLWQNTGATVIGIRRNGTIILSPGPNAIFMKKDVFIYIGEESACNKILNFLY